MYAASELARALVELGGVRTILMVPMRKDSATLGAFCIYRKEPRPFSEKQIALLQNFAAQAVIAMENARLLTETREALEQQTATAEVLQVINSSPGDLAPVFDAMLEKALHLCGAPYGILWNYDGEFFEVAAQRGVPKAFLDTMSGPQRPTSPETTRGRLVAGEHVVHITNLGADLLYQSGDQHRRALVDAAGAQVVVAVSLRKDDKLLGAFTIYRQEARPFTDKQIALVTTFADQAVIAMENARLITETREALEQQTATAEVLQVINSSPGDLAPVFDAMLEKAMRLCEAAFGTLWTIEVDRFRPVAHRGVPARYAEHLDAAAVGPAVTLPHTSLSGRAYHGELFAQVVDLADEELYREGDPDRRALVDLGGARTGLAIPLRKDKAVVGVILIYRQEIRPFSDKQIALLQNFAAQAVIAMENARLITETREALEQQTATAEVLGVINSSPGDLAAVFDAILEKAHSLCGAEIGSLQLYDGETLHAVATHAVPEEFADILRQGYRAADSPASRGLIEGERFIQISDCAEIDHPVVRSAAQLVGIRTLLVVPLRRDDAFLGLISAARLEVRPFTDKQIALLQNFAAQAVIAMENARLLTETREALEQQTATAEVLQVINSSPGDLAPVFDAMLGKATTLCEAVYGHLWTYDGQRFHPVAFHGEPAFGEYIYQRGAVLAVPDSPFERILKGERCIHIPDVLKDASYDASPGFREVINAGGIRTQLTVALSKDDVLLGLFVIYRQEVRPFSDKQIALLQNFAAQAVIAMENARLITETREALEQQTATAEVLQVINSSPGNLAPVFDAMLDKAANLCAAEAGVLFTYEHEHFQVAAWHGELTPLRDFLTREPLRPSPNTGLGSMARERRLIHIADVASRDSYKQGDPLSVASVDLGGIRTFMAVPLVKEGSLLGAFALYRQKVRPFSDKQIALLQNFAAQAVIAMENARLLTETREALEQQTATAEVLQVINSSPGDLAPVFDAILEKAHSFCGAVHGSLHIADADGFRGVAMRGVPEAFADFIKHPFQPGPNHPVRELIGGARTSSLACARVCSCRFGKTGLSAAILSRPDLKFGRSRTSRSHYCRISRLRRLLRWKTRGSSPRRGRRWSSRQRPLRYCRSSTPRRAISRRCSTRCSTGQYGFARRRTVTFLLMTAIPFIRRRSAVSGPISSGRSRWVPFGQVRALRWHELAAASASSILPMYGRKSFIVAFRRSESRPTSGASAAESG